MIMQTNNRIRTKRSRSGLIVAPADSSLRPKSVGVAVTVPLKNYRSLALKSKFRGLGQTHSAPPALRNTRIPISMATLALVAATIPVVNLDIIFSP